MDTQTKCIYTREMSIHHIYSSGNGSVITTQWKYIVLTYKIECLTISWFHGIMQSKSIFDHGAYIHQILYSKRIPSTNNTLIITCTCACVEQTYRSIILMNQLLSICDSLFLAFVIFRTPTISVSYSSMSHIQCESHKLWVPINKDLETEMIPSFDMTIKTGKT